MMRRITVWLPALMGLALIVTLGCAKPPQSEIDAANAALDEARASEAADYAEISLNEAEDAQAQLDAELRAQEEKFSMFRSYSKTNELASAVKTAADKATSDARAGKERAREEVSALISEARMMHEEAIDLLKTAPGGKGARADIEAMKADLAGVETSILEAEGAFDEERYVDARAKAEAAKSTAEGVRLAVEAARDAQRAARRG